MALAAGIHLGHFEVVAPLGAGEAESLFTQAEFARAEGREADALPLVDEARRLRVEIGDRPGIAECDAALARLGQGRVTA